MSGQSATRCIRSFVASWEPPSTLSIWGLPPEVQNTLEAVHAVQPAVQHCHAMCNAAGALAVHKAAMLNAPMLHAHHPRYAELPEQLDGFHDGDRWMHTPDGKGQRRTSAQSTQSSSLSGSTQKSEGHHWCGY